jgi:hypothetical protein
MKAEIVEMIRWFAHVGEGLVLQARMLPEADQPALARLLAAEISDEREWHHRFEASRPQLSELAD